MLTTCDRLGAVLVEVLAAMAIVSLFGISTLSFLAHHADRQARSDARHREIARAERVITATALLTAVELDQRIGRRDMGGMTVWVDRPEPGLYRIGITEAGHPDGELLATLIHRPPARSEPSGFPRPAPSAADSGQIR